MRRLSEPCEPDWRNAGLTDCVERLPGVHDWYNRRATRGNADTWFSYCLGLLRSTGLRDRVMLSLGCKTGALERSLWMLHPFGRYDGIDPSADRIEVARREAVAANFPTLGYQTANLNEVVLPVATYDAVWLNMTLGDVTDLEHLIGQIARTLKPDGFLFANEYIGSNRFATRRVQREAIKAAFSLVPRRLRERDELVLPGADGADGAWPVRTEEIAGILRRHFLFDEFNPICGSILQFVLNPAVDRFLAYPAAANPVIDMLFAIEEALVDSGEVAADYALIVARLKG